MIESDRHDDRHLCVGDIGRVPAPAHAHLDHGDIDGCVGECRIGHAGEHLEVRHGYVATRVDQRNVRSNFLVRGDEALGTDRLAVERDALEHGLEVRTRIAAGAQSEPAEQRLHHAYRAGLAVRARDENDRVGGLWLTQ